MADRFYCPEPPVEGRAVLDGDEARHLVRASRLTVGDPVELFDGRGLGYRAEVRQSGKDRVELAIVGEPIADRKPRIDLTLASAIPKGERFDWLIEKATELGVARLVPLRTARSVVDPRGSKLDRLRRLIIAASKQSGRNTLLELSPPRDLADYLQDEPSTVRLLAHPGGGPVPDRQFQPGDTVALAIGPEGGFADPEVQHARALGWDLIGLGPTRLRIETAALAGAVAILTRTRGA